MRIDPKVPTTPIARDTRESPSSAGASSKAGATDGSAAVVKLSSAGAAASAEPAVAAPTTTTRLQTIRAMLDKGDYPVDLDLLASRIVDDDVLRAGRS
jgi:anti-sigma28 factor (negative regulator of flagellin synthesis)